MLPIGFIASKKDLNLKLQAFKNAAGATGVTVFQTDAEQLTADNNLPAFLEKCSIIAIGAGACHNEEVVIQAIKKSTYVFLDFYEPVPEKLLQKIRKYHEEAGNYIAFNMAPFLMLNKQLGENQTDFQHIQVFSIRQHENMYSQAYAYLIFASGVLVGNNVKHSYHIIPNRNFQPELMVFDIYSLRGTYMHFTIGLNHSEQLKCLTFGNGHIHEYRINDRDIFNDNDSLKAQLDALYSKRPVGNLYNAIMVSEFLTKLNTVANKSGVFTEN